MTAKTTSPRSNAPVALDPLGEVLGRLIEPILRRAFADVLAEQEAVRQPQPELLTTEQICAALQISRATLHRLRLQGLPTVMLLDSPRWKVTECIRWLERRTAERAQGGER